MKYNIGDTVALTTGKTIEIAFVNKKSKTYVGRNGFVFPDHMIDHDKTAELKKHSISSQLNAELEKLVQGDTLEELTPEQIDILNEVGKNIAEYRENNAIEPAHYRKGLDDLYETAYRTRPFNEYRAIMEFVAERYIKRDKENRVEDLEKAIYTLERLKEKELDL